MDSMMPLDAMRHLHAVPGSKSSLGWEHGQLSLAWIGARVMRFCHAAIAVQDESPW